MIQCALCGHSEEDSLVSHIREKHDLKIYLSIFPDLPIVSPSLFAAVENLVYFSYKDDTPGLEEITKEEREIILTSSRNTAPLRSEISEIPDF